MGVDVTIIETAWGDKGAMIHIKHDGEEFKAAAQTLSDFMSALNLPADQHNQLVKLTVAQVEAAERSAYSQGFCLGYEFGCYETAQK